MFPIYILPIFIYLIYSKHLWTKKLCWSFCTNDRSWNHFFWVLRDSRTGISAIFNRLAYRLNDVFTKVCLYQLFGHPMNCNLNQSDEKSDQPGILGLDDPFEWLSTRTLKFEADLFSKEKLGLCNSFLTQDSGVYASIWMNRLFPKKSRLGHRSRSWTNP